MSGIACSPKVAWSAMGLTLGGDRGGRHGGPAGVGDGAVLHPGPCRPSIPTSTGSTTPTES